jgi:hypothetical protein
VELNAHCAQRHTIFVADEYLVLAYLLQVK